MWEVLVIKFKYVEINWIISVLLAFAMVLVGFLIEWIFSIVLLGILNKQFFWQEVFMRFIENGIFIPFLSTFISVGFGFIIEHYNLDYLKLYSKKTSKVVFSVMVTMFCIAMFMTVLSIYNKDDQMVSFLLNRIFMWLLTILGTWIGFGVGCKGRVEKNLEMEKTYKRNVSWKEEISYWWPIALGLVLCGIILNLTFSKIWIILQSYLFSILLSFLFVAFLTIILYYQVKFPSETRCVKNYWKAVKAYKNVGVGKGQYHKIRFVMKGKQLILDKIAVEYDGHQNDEEFIELFGKKNIPLNDDFDEMLEYLRKRDDLQDQYIKKAFEECVQEKKKEAESYHIKDNNTRR